ncbi:GNAT family N-acetyltransferase [Ferruginibacter lapsinanis]|uniref:GNAT family N-acetyltransferase n=1 Tax=Ferruginibacter lapsinanis TaxID=563172 RepID=UPI001E531BB4|nr:GNAT family N-acetyltransferase [Ferruginibacter lapsinanis]UEG48596.1 GNAT family N-acetyltransferase [Ferruginibacter lapsinanis]
MTINIRRLTIEDAEALSAIGAKTFYDTFTGTCTEEDMQQFLEEYYNIDQVKRELSDPEDYYYFAEIDNVPVGYLRLKEDYTSFETMKQWKALELKRLYVLQTHLGKGIAQVLMKFAINFAKQQNYEVVWLGVWEHNLRARKFYEKEGFKNTGYTHDFPIGNTPQTDCWYWKFLERNLQ